MTDYTLARKNMVDCQIATMGVIDPNVLSVLGAVPREEFLPENKRALAYLDEDLPLNNGAFLMEPFVFARLLQAASIKGTEKILNVGDNTGYSTAVLARLANRVTALELFPGQLSDAAGAWDRLGCGNILTAKGSTEQGYAASSPYDLILVNGSVPVIPQPLIDQLAEGGRLLTILRKPGGEGKAVMVAKLAYENHSTKILFDAATPYLADFIPKKAFVF